MVFTELQKNTDEGYHLWSQLCGRLPYCLFLGPAGQSFLSRTGLLTNFIGYAPFLDLYTFCTVFITTVLNVFIFIIEAGYDVGPWL
jgi:hypothetical protein